MRSCFKIEKILKLLPKVVQAESVRTEETKEGEHDKI
jgi:hypothetical protein